MRLLYIPKHLEIIDEKDIYKFIEMNSFGQLISLHDAEIVSTHMPFLFDEGSGVVVCHLAKATRTGNRYQNKKFLLPYRAKKII